MDQITEFISRYGSMRPNILDEDKASAKQMGMLEKCLQSDDYLMDEKKDGCRYKTFANRQFSKDNIEKTENFPLLQKFFHDLKMPNMFLDGEMYYPGKTSQYATRVTGAGVDKAIDFQKHNGYIHYCLFDILRTPNGTWLNNQPLEKRREYLQYLFDNYIKGTMYEEYIYLPPSTTKNKQQFVDKLLADGKEGGVLKKRNGIYYFDKKPMWEWMKIKQKDTMDLVIMGYAEPTKKYTGKDTANWKYWEDGEPVSENYYRGLIGSIILGAYKDGKLIQVAKTSGITMDLREAITNNKEAYLGQVVKITFMERTEAGYPRHPRFEMFHEDKQQHQVQFNEIMQDYL